MHFGRKLNSLYLSSSVTQRFEAMLLIATIIGFLSMTSIYLFFI